MKVKKHDIVALYIMMGILVGALIGSWIYIYRLDKFYTKAEVCKYTDDSFANLNIPKDVDVYFIKGVGDLWEPRRIKKDGIVTTGDYDRYGKNIRVKYDRDIYEVHATLLHELAHHRYYTDMSDAMKDRIDNKYDIICENPSELYAHTIDTYGKWLYD